jgi:hypothetical protein
LALCCALSLPAVATDWSESAEALAVEGEAVAAQSEWVDDGPIVGRPREEPLPFVRDGDGWAALDGWMRGDPLLRHWVLFRFDLDADRHLTPSEAAMARRGFYQIADVNRSDRITSEEFVAGWLVVREELRDFYAVDIIRPA